MEVRVLEQWGAGEGSLDILEWKLSFQQTLSGSPFLVKSERGRLKRSS